MPARAAGCRASKPTCGSPPGSGRRSVFRVPEDRDVVFEDVVRGDVRFQTDVIGDPVIVRADGHPAYNFAVVVDDALMEVTHVVRGEDHISNTPRQILLYEALGFTPPAFAHLALVMGPDHSPLSKRHGATSVAEFRSKGYLPEALVNYLALIGWSPGGGDELLPVDELARRFSLDAVGVSAGVFDEEKLAWANRHYLKMADPRRVAELSVPYFNQAGVKLSPDARGVEFLAAAMAMATSSVDRLDQVPARLALLFEYSPEATLSDARVSEEMRTEAAQTVVRALAQELARSPRLDREGFRGAANDVRARTGQKGKALFHPIRVALTGRAEGPRARPCDSGDRSRRRASARRRRAAHRRLPGARRGVCPSSRRVRLKSHDTSGDADLPLQAR